MKLIVRNTASPKPEPETEFWLEKAGDSIYLRAQPPGGSPWNVLVLSKDGVKLCTHITSDIGIARGDLARVKLL